MKYIIAALLVFASIYVVHGQGKASPSNRNENHTTDANNPKPESPSSNTVIVVEQEAANAQDDRAKSDSKGYFKRLFTPENLPNIVLCLVGIGGIIVAVCTLRIIERQTKHLRNSVVQARRAANAARQSTDALINSERAWVLVESAQIVSIAGGQGGTLVSPIVRNFGKNVTRVCKIRVGVRILAIGQELLPLPYYQESKELDFVLYPNREFSPIDIPVADTDFNAATNGAKLFYIYGVVDYLSDKERTTGFCLIACPTRGDKHAVFYPAVKVPAAYTHYT
jgi:hypothetical protein